MPSLHGPKEKPDILVRSWRMSTVWGPHARVSDVSQARGKKNFTVLTAKLLQLWKRFIELKTKSIKTSTTGDRLIVFCGHCFSSIEARIVFLQNGPLRKGSQRMQRT